jgi:hypothetical protein
MRSFAEDPASALGAGPAGAARLVADTVNVSAAISCQVELFHPIFTPRLSDIDLFGQFLLPTEILTVSTEISIG